MEGMEYNEEKIRHMKSFRAFLIEDGAIAGKLELVSTNLKDARDYAEREFSKNGRDLDQEIPDFDNNYIFAQKQTGTGKTTRKDMPVIDSKHVKDLQDRLSNGYIDIKSPHPKSVKNPFPKGLTPKTGKQWLENGLKKNDGDDNDDKVSVSLKTISVGELHPIQKQIYFDKSIAKLSKFGVADSRKFMANKNNIFIMSKDRHIIDGHHRYLSAVLQNPNMKVNVLVIDLPIKQLLPLTLSYSDAVGNKRNA